MSKKAAPGKTGGSKKDGAVRNESSKSVEPPEDVEVHSSIILRQNSCSQSVMSVTLSFYHTFIVLTSILLFNL